MTAQIKVKVQRKAIVKLNVLPKFPADVVAETGLIITRSGRTYTFALDLANAPVTGRLPFANLTQGSARSVLGVTGNATADFASIQGSAGQILAVPNAGTSLAFTATPQLGASGTLGSLTLGNATSGLLTLRPVTGALGTVTLSLPAATDTLVGRATTDTLTNKTISGAIISSGSFSTDDNNWFLWDSADFSKNLKFELSGITTGTTRTLTIPDASTTIVGTDTTQTLTNKTISGATITSGTFATTDTNWSLWDDGDITKVMKFQLSGITAGTTRTLTVPDASTTLVGTDTTQALTNKTVNGLTITSTTGTLNMANGVTMTGPPSTGTVMTLGNTETVTGVKTFGSAGAVGRLKIAGTTSGAITLDATAIAGSGTLTLPAATDTLVGKATTDTLTNKTFDTAGTGNSFSINSVAVTANTGTGAVARAASPTFTTPTLGAATATTINGATVPSVSDTLVGKATTDTLTNKSISGSTNTFTSIPGTAIRMGSDAQGDVLYFNGTDYVRLAAGASGNFLKTLGAGANPAWAAVPGGGDMLAANLLSDVGTTAANQTTSRNNISAALSGHIFGLTLQNNGGDVVNDIDILAGEAASTETNPVLMRLSSTLTKRLDAAWAVGTNQGGLDTGSIANACYHIWLIQRSDTGVVDALFSTSASAPTMPTNYDRKRRIGSILRASAAILAFTQTGDIFMFSVPILDVNTSTLSTTAVLYALSTPLGVKCVAIGSVVWYHGSTGNYGLISSPDMVDAAPNDGASPGANVNVYSASFTTLSQLEILTNTSSQIRARSVAASTVFRWITLGYKDTRGKYA